MLKKTLVTLLLLVAIISAAYLYIQKSIYVDVKVPLNIRLGQTASEIVRENDLEGISESFGSDRLAFTQIELDGRKLKGVPTWTQGIVLATETLCDTPRLDSISLESKSFKTVQEATKILKEIEKGLVYLGKPTRGNIQQAIQGTTLLSDFFVKKTVNGIEYTPATTGQEIGNWWANKETIPEFIGYNFTQPEWAEYANRNWLDQLGYELKWFQDDLNVLAGPVETISLDLLLTHEKPTTYRFSLTYGFNRDMKAVKEEISRCDPD